MLSTLNVCLPMPNGVPLNQSLKLQAILFKSKFTKLENLFWISLLIGFLSKSPLPYLLFFIISCEICFNESSGGHIFCDCLEHAALHRAAARGRFNFMNSYNHGISRLAVRKISAKLCQIGVAVLHWQIGVVFLYQLRRSLCHGQMFRPCRLQRQNPPCLLCRRQR